MFDYRHDPQKQDTEFTPDGQRHWTRKRYWQKLNHIGQDILSCSVALPDLVALCEVENDTVLHDLTRRSLLRNAGYEYLMTESPDVRGIDVALLYRPVTFRPLCYECIQVEPLKDMRPTRDILYIKGVTRTTDTLHIFIVHAPSRYGGELHSRPFRLHVARTLAAHLPSPQENNIIVAGDFNDYAESPSLQLIEQQGMVNMTKRLKENGKRNARKDIRGNYRFKGEWHSLDHILLSPGMISKADTFYINAAPFLLEEETTYGGYRPRRSFNGYHYRQGGFSDHLPLVLRFKEK
jgi:endonuclease/exonuclease/phosphatase family metal-dependent hydrolase